MEISSEQLQELASKTQADIYALMQSIAVEHRRPNIAITGKASTGQGVNFHAIDLSEKQELFKQIGGLYHLVRAAGLTGKNIMQRMQVKAGLSIPGVREKIDEAEKTLHSKMIEQKIKMILINPDHEDKTTRFFVIFENEAGQQTAKPVSLQDIL